MKGDAQVITHLNKALGNELIAINQYFLHSRMLQDWGLQKLADKAYHESLDEMKHADELIQRILLLEGLPNMQDLGRLMIGESPKETLECDLRLELQGIDDLRAGVAYAESIADYGSRNLLQSVLLHEEEHIEWLEMQLHLISQVGLENYLQQQM